jgi:hypothetical protein
MIQLAAGLGAGLDIMGGILSFGSAYREGKQKARMYSDYAAMSKMEREEAARAGRWQQRAILQEGEDVMAEQRALAGESGITLEGTPMDIMEETQRSIMMDSMMAGREARIAEKVAWMEEQSYKRAAKSSRKSGIMGAIGSLF